MASQGSSFYDTLKSSPVLTGKSSATYAGSDDATKAFTALLKDLARGHKGAVMPFRHPEFLRQACLKLAEVTGEAHYTTMAAQFALQDLYATVRNLRLMLKFNLMLMRKGKATFIISEKDQELFNELAYLKEQATLLGVDVSGYLDESYDEQDIAGCDNDFCLNQRDKAGEAGDLVTILRDAEGQDHVLLIVRANAPGKSQVALPGGFKEAKDKSAAAMCQREGDEETGYKARGVNTRYFELTQVQSKTWDPRPLFAKHGMINDGLLRFDVVHAA